METSHTRPLGPREDSAKRGALGAFLRAAARGLALAALLLIAASPRVFAAGEPPRPESPVSLRFLTADIVIDGRMVENYFLSVPVTEDEAGNAYLPASAEMLSALGLDLRYTAGSGAVHTPAAGDSFDTWLSAVSSRYAEGITPQNVSPNVMEIRKRPKEAKFGTTLVYNLVYNDSAVAKDCVVVACEAFAPQGASPLDITASGEGAKGRKITGFSGENVFLLSASGRIYLPLSLFEDGNPFGVSVYYSRYEGLYISTDPDIPASRYVNRANLSFIRGVSQWINEMRPELSAEEARYYEYVFRHEANVCGLDELTLIGLGAVESHLTAGAGGNGTVGIMQTQARYAANYGYTEEMLRTPHYSVELGAMYLRDRFWTFDGNIVKALAAYNKGINAVKAGNYTATFANRVLGYKSQIIRSLIEKGCATQLQVS